MGRVYGDLHPGALYSKVQPGAPGETHGREGLVRGKGTHAEQVCGRSSEGEQLDEGGYWEGLHLREGHGAACAKYHNLAQQWLQGELEGRKETGAQELSNEAGKSLGGREDGRMGRWCAVAAGA